MIWKAKLYILDIQHTTSFGQDTFWTYNILQVLEKMEIEDFTEDEFYQEGIPENIFRNLIQLEPNVYGEFQLPEDIWEDGEDIVIVEHNDIYNDPIYRSSDDDISDEQEDGYQEDDDYEQVDGYVGQDYRK